MTLTEMIKERIKEWINKALIILDWILDIVRPKLSCLRPWAPTLTPVTWIYVNGSCCMSTAMFFLLGWLPKQTIGYDFAHLFYIPFNLIICVIWFVEISLWMLFDEDSPAWHKLAELLISMFFCVDGIIWVFGWLVLDEELENKMMLIYTALDFFVYLFYLMLAIRAEARAAMKAQLTAQDLEETEIVQIPAADAPKETETEFKLMP
jgi:hypothetical protein